MRRIIGLTAAAAILGMASAASAGEWTGTIKEIDETSRNIVVTDAAAPDQEQPPTPEAGEEPRPPGTL